MKMDLDLCPLSYDELCQMELLHADNTGSNSTPMPAATTAAPVNSAILPVMVIPTSLVPAGAVLASSVAAATTPANTVAVATLPTSCCVPENYYQLLASAQPASQVFLVATPPPNLDPHANASAAVIPTSNATETSLKNRLFENTTLPRRLQSTAKHAMQASGAPADESDFEGSECGASVTASTCIPHFRFSGCSVMLQPVSVNSQQQQQQQQQQNQQQQTHSQQHQLLGCGSLSHMMGSFAAAAAGGALQSSRLVGTLVGVGTSGLSSTLGRHRRSGHEASGTHKRVSFKADLVPPEQMLDYSDCVEWQDYGLLRGVPPPADAFNNGERMPFGSFMDYQVRAETNC